MAAVICLAASAHALSVVSLRSSRCPDLRKPLTRAPTPVLQQGGPPQTAAPGGPPPGVRAGGPPGGGPPGGGPPGGGGPPRGGPPPRTPIQQVLDTLFEAGFTLLYSFEPDGMLDSSKNLRVLWVRALLAASGELDDTVASELLPPASRWVVGPALAPLWSPVLPKLQWIRQRTEFIDGILTEFVASVPEGSRAQAVLLGSGYDTRALRFRGAPIDFYEVDLPSVRGSAGSL